MAVTLAGAVSAVAGAVGAVAAAAGAAAGAVGAVAGAVGAVAAAVGAVEVVFVPVAVALSGDPDLALADSKQNKHLSINKKMIFPSLRICYYKIARVFMYICVCTEHRAICRCVCVCVCDIGSSGCLGMQVKRCGVSVVLQN